jgi:hypothetical protein
VSDRTDFPCGCACERRGEILASRLCDAHEAVHAASVTLDETHFAGCDCPGCEFGKYAAAREPIAGSAWPDNWKFLARLRARRAKAAAS